MARSSQHEPLECYGDVEHQRGKAPDKRTHGPVEIEKTETTDGTFWTCPECGWLLKEFMGVHVDDV